jgi:hypothetical protein
MFLQMFAFSLILSTSKAFCSKANGFKSLKLSSKILKMKGGNSETEELKPFYTLGNFVIVLIYISTFVHVHALFINIVTKYAYDII